MSTDTQQVIIEQPRTLIDLQTMLAQKLEGKFLGAEEVWEGLTSPQMTLFIADKPEFRGRHISYGHVAITPNGIEIHINRPDIKTAAEEAFHALHDLTNDGICSMYERMKAIDKEIADIRRLFNHFTSQLPITLDMITRQVDEFIRRTGLRFEDPEDLRTKLNMYIEDPRLISNVRFPIGTIIRIAETMHRLNLVDDQVLPLCTELRGVLHEQNSTFVDYIESALSDTFMKFDEVNSRIGVSKDLRALQQILTDCLPNISDYDIRKIIEESCITGIGEVMRIKELHVSIQAFNEGDSIQALRKFLQTPVTVDEVDQIARSLEITFDDGEGEVQHYLTGSPLPQKSLAEKISQINEWISETESLDVTEHPFEPRNFRIGRIRICLSELMNHIQSEVVEECNIADAAQHLDFFDDLPTEPTDRERLLSSPEFMRMQLVAIANAMRTSSDFIGTVFSPQQRWQEVNTHGRHVAMKEAQKIVSGQLSAQVQLVLEATELAVRRRGHPLRRTLENEFLNLQTMLDGLMDIYPEKTPLELLEIITTLSHRISELNFEQSGIKVEATLLTEPLAKVVAAITAGIGVDDISIHRHTYPAMSEFGNQPGTALNALMHGIHDAIMKEGITFIRRAMQCTSYSALLASSPHIEDRMAAFGEN